MMTWRLSASAALVIILGGCHLILPYAPAPRDSAASQETAGTDAGDGPWASDSTPDANPVDGAVDSVPDIHADDGTSDTSVDSSTPDSTAQDGSLTGVGCNAAFATPYQLYTPSMVLCGSATTKRNQCDAESSFCDTAAGWSMCTPAQYLARGGDTTPPTNTAWIKACIRNGADPIAPTAGLCSSCAPQTVGIMTIAWQCSSTGSTGGSSSHTGVAAYSVCHKIGANSPTNKGMWIGRSTSFEAYGAVCCK
jgi:hypothetical protein